MPRNQDETIRRANVIFDLLARRDYISVGELVELLGVSAVTIRKDLAALEQRGLLRRTHGGAIPVAQAAPKSNYISQSFEENQNKQREEKIAIGLAAAALVKDGDVLAFTGGTTATQVARSLGQKTHLTVITNAINIALDLSHLPGLTIFVPGGFLRGDMYSLVSVSALERIRNFTIDRMFIGVNGIHPEHGLTELMNDQAVIHRALIEQSKQRIVVADHTKLGQIYRAYMGAVDEMQALVTDTRADAAQVALLRARGLEVILAPYTNS